MQASKVATVTGKDPSIIVLEEEETVEEDVETIEEEEVIEEERPRRSTRSVSTKAAADASTQRRRSVEPVRYAQLQEEDAALAKLKYAQLTQFRKGEKRARPSDSKINGGGGGRSSSSSSSKRSRAEERRSARQARRREGRSPTLSSMAKDEDADAWRALPAMALDGSGPRSLRFQRPADAVVATVTHSTAWRRVQLRPLSAPPSNLLPVTVTTPFAADLERPLESYDESLASECRIRRPAVAETYAEDGAERTEEQLQTHVAALLADVTPRVQHCHATRVTHVLTTTRQRVRACLAQLPTARQAAAAVCVGSFTTSPTTTKISPLEAVVADRQRENVVLPADRSAEDQLPVYFIGRGENTVRERGVLPKEPVRTLPALPFLSRSTTCVGVRGTLPVDDDPILRSVPVFTSAPTDASPVAALVAASTLSALDDDRHELMLRFVVHATAGETRVFRVLRMLAWATQPQTDYAALQVRAAHARVAALLATRDDHTQPKPPPPDTLATRLCGDVGDKTTAFTRRELTGGEVEEEDALLRGFRSLFCRRCYVYNCQFHDIYQPRAIARIDPVYPTVKTSLRSGFEPVEAEARIATAEEEEENKGGDAPTAEVEEEEPVEETREDVEMESVEVRRSVRSVTAAATKASTLLVVQATVTKKTTITKKHPLSSSSRSSKRHPLADASEYFGYDALYRKITLAKHTAMLQHSPHPEALEAMGCSATCYKTHTHTTVAAAVWTPLELALLRLAQSKVGSRACVLSHFLATKNCAEVYAQLTLPPPAVHELQIAQAELRALRPHPRTRSAHDHVATVRGNTSDHLHRTRVQRMKDRGSNHQYVPCHHATGDSTCNTNACACMRRDHFCEAACGCPPDCANRFPGCRCALPSVCGTLACPCFFAARECDPDICRSCRACEVPLLALNPRQRGVTNTALRVCANTNILRGVHRAVGVAESTTHGWGAFAREAIRANDFIYEYTGELLAQDEAERRGNVYDRNAVSFLFDLNEDVVVDAARKGNKSKFANHASTEPNCVARIMLVRGDHRIGLYAKRAIAKGDELFFDYGHHGVVPDWSQSRIRSMEVKGLRPGTAEEEENNSNSTVSSPGRVEEGTRAVLPTEEKVEEKNEEGEFKSGGDGGGSREQRGSDDDTRLEATHKESEDVMMADAEK